MLTGTFQVLFQESFYNPDERPQLLNAMMNFAAECAIGESYWPVFRAMQAKYPDLLGGVKFDDPLDTLLFVFFDEAPAYSTFERACSLFSYKIELAKIEATEAMLAVCREFYDAGRAEYDRFKAQYSPFFEQALTDYHLAPEYAWLVACDRAGLPVDEWVRDWPGEFEWFPYHLTEQDSTKEVA